MIYLWLFNIYVDDVVNTMVLEKGLELLHVMRIVTGLRNQLLFAADSALVAHS